MSARQPYPPEFRAAVVADYRASGDTLAQVARRHGVSTSALCQWAKANPRKAMTQGPRVCDDDDLAYFGGWERVGLVQRPLFAEQRSA